MLHVEVYADDNGTLQEKENVLLPFCKQQCFVSLKKEMDKAEADLQFLNILLSWTLPGHPPYMYVTFVLSSQTIKAVIAYCFLRLK
jgi:hypothetical protein